MLLWKTEVPWGVKEIWGVLINRGGKICEKLKILFVMITMTLDVHSSTSLLNHSVKSIKMLF